MRLFLSILTVFVLFAGTAFAQPTRVFVVGWDGADQKVVRAMYDGGELPNLAALGSLSTMYAAGVTVTKASWAKIFTGLGSEETGVWTNNIFNAIPPGQTIFEKLKTSIGTYNIFIAGKARNLGITNNEPFSNAVWSFDAFSVNNDDKTAIYNTANSFLTEYYLNHSQTPLLAFIHTGEPDYQGHQFGVDSPEYVNNIKGLDVLLGQLLNKIAGYGMANTYIMVISDHGFNHLNAPYPFPFGKGVQNTHHTVAPYGIIVSNFKTFPRGFSNMEMADMILGLYSLAPAK